MPRSLIPVVEELSPATLTVMAQTISPNDQGMLKWDGFFPREDVDSVDLDEITTLDFRPTSDRRAWNSRGRLIPNLTPDTRHISIVPVEGYYTWNEYDMQKMAERAAGNEQIVNDILGRSIPGKVRQITEANYRRIEVDAFTAWALGTVTVKNPQTGATYSASFNFAAERMATAGTAWNDASVNAYDEFLAFMEDAVDLIGPTVGAVMRLSTLRAIEADAPDLLGGVRMTRAQLGQRIQDDLGRPFAFYLFDDTVDVFTDGGTATTSTNVWAAGRVAAVPAGERVGRTAFAPVVRAMELARQLPAAGIDERGMTVYYDEANTGRELTVEVQANPITIPNEQRVAVINSGVS